MSILIKNLKLPKDEVLLIYSDGEVRTQDWKKYSAVEVPDDVQSVKWIPVTERLPEKDVPVLVYLFGSYPYIAWINRDGEWETEEFTIDHDYLPKAWMPLPEPPKDGEP